MEFDNNTPVSDDQRRLAESKKITLQPVHTNIQPDDLPGSEIAAHHVNEPAIANLESDTEQDKTFIQPSEGLLHQSEATKNGSGFTIGIVAAAAVITLLVGGFLFFR